MRADEISIPCMPLQMEISLDNSFETSRKVRIEEEQNHQTLEEENKKFYDAQDKKKLKKPWELELSKTQQKKQA